MTDYIKTRFGYKPIEIVIGWTVVISVVFGMVGGFFVAWLMGLN